MMKNQFAVAMRRPIVRAPVVSKTKFLFALITYIDFTSTNPGQLGLLE